MKVLIIEDSESKLGYTKRILNEHSITDIVHFNNLEEAIMRCFCSDEITEFDLIILDLCFYIHRPFFKGESLDLHAGFHFLNELKKFILDFMEENYSKFENRVIIHSTETTYAEELHEYIWDNITEKDWHNITTKGEYSDISTFTRIQQNTISSFIFGHAHDETELDDLISKFIKAV